MIPENSTQKVEEAAHAYAADSKFVLVENAIADADMLQKAGKIDEAVEKWRAIANITEGADDTLAADAWFNAGYLTVQLASTYCSLGHGKIKEAIAAYDNAVRLDSRHAEAYLYRGKAKNTLEHYNAALSDFNEALRLNPNCAETRTARGVAKFGLGEHKAAFSEHAAATPFKSELCRGILQPWGSQK